MTFQHKTQASGQWNKLSFLEQVANIGSEVERAISWREKGNEEYSTQAFYRSIELFLLTMSCPTITSNQLREIARAREAWTDFFAFDNIYKSTEDLWRNYFNQFLILLRNTKKKRK